MTFIPVMAGHQAALGALGGFDPSSLALLIYANLSAPGGVSVSGTTITSVNDLSGNGNHFNVVSGSPQSGTRSINGKNAADFNGTNQAVATTTTFAPGTSDTGWFCVMLLDTIGDSWPCGEGPSGSNGKARGFAQLSGSFWGIAHWVNDVASSTTRTTGTAQLLIGNDSSGTTSNMWIDGTQIITNGTVPSGYNLSTAAPVRLGQGPVSRWHDGLVAAFGIRRSVFTGTEIANLRAWSQAQYATA